MARTKKIEPKPEKITVKKVKEKIEDNKIVNKKRKSRKAKCGIFARYIYRVFKSIGNVPTTISVKAMATVHDFVMDLLERISSHASSMLNKTGKRKTILAHDIKSAVKLLLPGQLAVYAARYASEHMSTYYKNTH